MHNNKFKKIYLIIIIFIFCVLTLGKEHINKTVFAEKSTDAIAIRIIPNPEHYSALRWYKNQGFSGSPQSLIVDGYEAIRDGRTVYINAANIATDGNLYTNIHIILHNQKAGQETQDIFSRILSHWKFNTNISSFGQCNETGSVICAIDSDCPISEYCSSDKAKIIRDTKRLADLAEIEILLEKYRAENNRYPTLKAGSYLPNKTISVWPSWQKVLAQELKTVLPQDPVNKLGDCGDDRFHPITCWDSQKNEFADTDQDNPAMNLPAGSKVYAYGSVTNGLGYDICSVMESGYVFGVGSGACDSSNSINIGHEATNQQPIFTGINLPTGYSGEEYKGLIEAKDPDGDVLSWSIDTSATTWTMWQPVPEMLPVSQNQKRIYSQIAGVVGNYVFTITIDDNKNKSNSTTEQTFTISIINPLPVIIANNIVYVASTTNPLEYSLNFKDSILSYPLVYDLTQGSILSGLTGNYIEPTAPFQENDYYTFEINGVIDPLLNPVPETKNYNYTIKVTDNFNASSLRDFVITVVNNSPNISMNTDELKAIVGYAIPMIKITAEDPEGNELLPYSLSNVLPQGLISEQISEYEYRISGIPIPYTPVSDNYQNSVTVNDIYGATSNKTFNIKIINNKPIINQITCDAITRWNNPYSCTITATDPDGHAIVGYSLTGTYPFGLSIDNSGVISGSPLEVGYFNLKITATDKYGAVSEPKIFALRVNNYCGDNIRQTPNMEGVSEICEDGNTNDNDACDSDCEWTCKSADANFSAGGGDGTIYDNDSNVSEADDVANGNYLKILGVMPTPYIWIANSSINKVSKLRTYDGKKRNCARNADDTVDCWWVDGTWEVMGQLIGTYNVGINPSRTAVNVETGDVWIANRNSGNVTKLDINGAHLKTCVTGVGPRGVAIEKNGDVWVGNYSGGGVVKISGNDTSCGILKTVAVSSYGLAIDSDGNIWSAYGTNGATKIDVNNGFSTTLYPASGGYGITVDLDDNVWLGGYPAGHGAIRINPSTGVVSYFGTGYNGLGLTINLNNDVWPSTHTNNGILKISPGNHPVGQDYVFRRNSGGSDAHGACGDSEGNVWVVNNSSGTTRVFNSNGDILGAGSTASNATIGLDGLRVFKAYKDGAFSTTYSYSDMTGLNRALLLRLGIWKDTFDSGYNDQHWGGVSWESIISSAKQSIEIFVRASNDIDFDGVNWLTAQEWNSFNYDNNVRKGRYAQIKVKMRSSERGVTPVLWDLKFVCD